MPGLTELPYPDSSLDLFRRLRSLPLPVILHSGQSQHPDARFDVLAADPQIKFHYENGIFTIESEAEVQRINTDNPFATLDQHMSLDEGFFLNEALPLQYGLIGYFAYSALHRQHRVQTNMDRGPALPEVLAGTYAWIIVVDHHLKRCHLSWQDSCPDGKLERLQELLRQPAPEAQGFSLQTDFVSNLSWRDYEAMFEQAMNYIHAGDCYQVNLAQCFQAACKGDSFSAFCRLQSLAQAPFAAYIEHAQQAVLCFSPERFLQVRNKRVLTQPIKGTRPRYANSKEDRAALDDLLGSAKDRAENLMIVDLLRNDLGRVCQTGSVEVKSLFEAHSFPNVHHLLSAIVGELDQAQDIWHLLAACFPGGSITGTPKRRAMEIIEELETVPRSVYCGSIAWIDQNGNMDSNIAIRTLVRDDDQLYCWGGGGIVADSRAREEYQESLDKIALFLDALAKP